jgi:hypothetical protein
VVIGKGLPLLLRVRAAENGPSHHPAAAFQSVAFAGLTVID